MLITILFPIIDPFTLCAFCTKFGDNSVQNAQVVLNDRPNHQFPYTLPFFSKFEVCGEAEDLHDISIVFKIL